MPGAETELVCPGCAARAPGAARFCDACGLPLVFDDSPGPAAPPSERRRQLRKIKPQLAEGPLVKVAWARHQAEGEFVQGLLLEQGVPSLLRRAAGFDVPDMLAAGPRDVLVPASGVDTAREALLDAGLTGARPPGPPVAVGPRPARLLVGLCGALAAGAGVIYLISLVVH